ncbi:hypothetical protein CF319_g6678 [Tilletia indica]|nr:hypothetical protein CF319_g6678 [Tilletia indica]
MASYPTPPPPPPFAPGPLQLPAPYPSSSSSNSSGLQPPSPAPGTFLSNNTSGHAPPAPNPFTVALPGGGISSYSAPGSAAPSPAQSIILPLGPPPAGSSNSKRAGASARGGAGGAGAGRARQTKSASVDPVQADDELLPPPTPGARNEEEDAEEEEEEELEQNGDEMESMEARQQARQENMPYLIEAMTPEQDERHNAYRRSSVARGSVKKLMNQVLSQSVSDDVALVASGAAKIFIGEIVEKARELQAKEARSNTSNNNLGPLRPEHIQEAFRLYTLERDRPGRFPPAGGAPGMGKRRRIF